MQMQQTVHETHILKIMSFISSRVNHPGSIRKLSLTNIISRSKSLLVSLRSCGFGGYLQVDGTETEISATPCTYAAQ